MEKFPHRYTVQAGADAEGPVRLGATGLPELESLAPAEFGGPGDRWSPETLFLAAVADCLLLTFRAIARNSSFAWNGLRCKAEGVLDRVEGKVRFTEIVLRCELVLPEGADGGRGERLLEKAERSCLVTNSITASVRLEPHVVAA